MRRGACLTQPGDAVAARGDRGDKAVQLGVRLSCRSFSRPTGAQARRHRLRYEVLLMFSAVQGLVRAAVYGKNSVCVASPRKALMSPSKKR